MTGLAIRAERLGKRFRIGRQAAGYRTLRETLAQGLVGVLRRPLTALRSSRLRRMSEDVIWALAEVSFEVQGGEVVGIIGGNGAGKSTLLKILSRITAPTSGRVRIRGRVGSLLEVGTGFHSELTGRENIFLNAAILGMRRDEILRRFEEIVDFAEVGRFLDTPVKRYSSGMYLRLAFSVAAHLEPDILLVDEVLAVGDARFQEKCLGRMGDVARTGRTILFVTHNMDAVRRLCPRSILLEQGMIAYDGDSATAITRYLARQSTAAVPGGWIELAGASRSGSGEARFTRARFTVPGEAEDTFPFPDGSLALDVEIVSDAPRSVPSMAVSLRTLGGTLLVDADVAEQAVLLQLEQGSNQLALRIPSLHLNPGLYDVGLWLGEMQGEGYDHIPSAFRIQVVDSGAKGLGLAPAVGGPVPCILAVDGLAPARGSSPGRRSSGRSR